MQTKNFDPELLRLHPNRRHGTSLGNSPSGRPVFHKTELKETDRNNEGVSYNIRNRESRKAVPTYSTRKKRLAATAKN